MVLRGIFIARNATERETSWKSVGVQFGWPISARHAPRIPHAVRRTNRQRLSFIGIFRSCRARFGRGVNTILSYTDKRCLFSGLPKRFCFGSIVYAVHAYFGPCPRVVFDCCVTLAFFPCRALRTMSGYGFQTVCTRTNITRASCTSYYHIIVLLISCYRVTDWIGRPTYHTAFRRCVDCVVPRARIRQTQ